MLEQYDITKYMGQKVTGKVHPFGRWAESFGVSLPSPVAPVCYGGSFAVAAERIGPRRELMQQFASVLAKSRTNSDCHFVERLWASLFHDAPTNDTSARILRQQRKMMQKQNHYMGTLIGNPCPGVALPSAATRRQ